MVSEKQEELDRKEFAMKPKSENLSRLVQWPCQIKLVPPNAPYFDGADLVIAGDCTAYAYASFHDDFMKDRITLITCPRLDAVDDTEKLAAILQNNQVQSIAVVHMEVPCCSGLAEMVENALKISGKKIPIRLIMISTDGKIISRD